MVVLALTPGERDLLVRALRGHRTKGLRGKAAVLEMLENATPAAALKRLYR